MARQRGHPRNDDGFTLVELMVVVMIIAILIAIAVPTFVSAREGANQSAAKSVLGNGHRALKITLSDAREISSVTPLELQDAEPSIRFNDEATTAEAESNEVSVAVGSDYVILATHAAGDGCLALRELEGAATQYQRLAGPACPATAFDPNAGWLDDWPSMT